MSRTAWLVIAGAICTISVVLVIGWATHASGDDVDVIAWRRTLARPPTTATAFHQIVECEEIGRRQLHDLKARCRELALPMALLVDECIEGCKALRLAGPSLLTSPAGAEARAAVAERCAKKPPAPDYCGALLR